MAEKHPLDQLEPAALSDTAVFPMMVNSKLDIFRVQVSVAISLKRIADALGAPDAKGKIGDIAFWAGADFERGRKFERGHG